MTEEPRCRAGRLMRRRAPSTLATCKALRTRVPVFDGIAMVSPGHPLPQAHHGKGASWERVVFCCWHNHSVHYNLEQKPIQTRAHLVRRFVAKDGTALIRFNRL